MSRSLIKSKLINVSRTLDKYPDMPEFGPRTKITFMDEDGPGVVTNFHVSEYYNWYSYFSDDFSPKAVDTPENCSHMYLPMPYKKHIRIEVENLGENKLIGYMSIQHRQLNKRDDSLGYLTVAYKKDNACIPVDKLELMNVQHGGNLVAHWLYLSADNPLTGEGEYVCEANDEFYVDGEETPSLEYLGTEDLYGCSWGFQTLQADTCSAITVKDYTTKGGSNIGMLRCRNRDSIAFESSLRFVMDYQQEYFSKLTKNPKNAKRSKESIEIDYISAVYYYRRTT